MLRNNINHKARDAMKFIGLKPETYQCYLVYTQLLSHFRTFFGC